MKKRIKNAIQWAVFAALITIGVIVIGCIITN